MFSKNNNSKKNQAIELLRFCFATAITLGHAYALFTKEFDHRGIYFKNAIPGVEFFFIVSGYFMAVSVFEKESQATSCREIGDSTLKFFWKKYKALFPTALFVFAIIFISNYVIHPASFERIYYRFLECIPEIFLFQMGGINLGSGTMNLNNWFTSALFISILIIYPLLKRFGKYFSKVLAPLASIIIIGYIFRETGTLAGSGSVLAGGWLLKGVLRAIADLSLGIFVYEVVLIFNHVKLNKLGQVVIGLLEVVLWINTLYFMCDGKDEHKLMFVYTYIIAIAAVITFSEHSLLRKIPKYGWIYYLGDLSMTMYISQRIFLSTMDEFYFESYWLNYFGLYIFTIVTSVIIKAVLDQLKKCHGVFVKA